MAREQIINALFEVLQQSAEFKVASRKNQNPEGLSWQTQCPALFLVENTNKFDRSAGYNQLAKRDLHMWAILYNAIDPSDVNGLAVSALNNALDTLETLFVPDNWQTQTFTLGGLVQACLIDGTVLQSPGEITNRAIAMVPIRILLP